MAPSRLWPLLGLLVAPPLGAQTASEEVLSLPTLGISAPGATDGYQTRRSSTGTRTDTPLRDIPQSVNVVTQQAIRDLSMQNLQDVMRYVPGAGFAQGEGNRDTPVLRGQSTTASLFVDGIRDDAQYYRDLYNIDRVETLLGPSGMIFGRGGAGGIINRVTRQADWNQHREVRLQAGSFGDYRGSFDVGDAINAHAAYRVMGMYEASDSFRDGVTLRRSGINPTAAFRTSGGTLLRISYENFRDERTADRGIPSFAGRPFATARGNFFGDPNISPSQVNLNAVGAFAEHEFDNNITLRNQFHFAAYDKFYQNVYASSAVNAAGTGYNVSAYNNSQKRDNLFNQTDVIARFATGPIRHELLTGLELATQQTDNLRLTGYFTSIGANTTSVTASVFAPRINLPVAFRPSATDTNNSGTANTVALYVQDQVQITPKLQLVAGLRFENFNVDFTNNRNGQNFNVTNNFVSPRVGLIYKPVEPLSLYASFSNSYLPRAGEQLASLTLSNANLQPEGFTNYEVGAKWDIRQDLSLTAALFRLDRTNVAVTNPADVTQLTLVNGTRTKGVEIGLRGRVTEAWSVMGGYAYTEGEILGTQSATIRSGNTTPFLARNTVSLWNRYDFQPDFGGYAPRLGLGLGIINQSSYFAAADNAVRIPGFTRFDAAGFWEIKPGITAQLNFENLAGARYYPVADNNNNISPGAPFAVRGALTSRF
ncbi:MAG: TonB-dependent siderophore receptor [Roseococcus sp.]